MTAASDLPAKQDIQEMATVELKIRQVEGSEESKVDDDQEMAEAPAEPEGRVLRKRKVS